MIDAPEKNPPLASFVMICFNQERYIREALAGALAQTYSPMEIIVSDDNSSDRTFEIVEEIAASYHGPHTLRINKNSVNLGIAGQVNHVTAVAAGDFIIASAGDDVSTPHRTHEIMAAFEATQAMIIHSDVIAIDDAGNALEARSPPLVQDQQTILDAVSSGGLYIGASGAWSKKLFGVFGPIQQAGAYEDLVLGFRGMLLNSIHHIPKPLVNYRVHGGISNHRRTSILRPWEFKRIRIKILTMEIAVARQRLSDTAKMPQDDHIKKIQAALSQRLKTKEEKLQKYQNNLHLQSAIKKIEHNLRRLLKKH